MKRAKTITLLRIAAIVPVLGLFAWLVHRNIGALDFHSVRWNFFDLALSIALLQAGMLANVAFLRFAFRFLGAPIGFGEAYSFFFVSNIGRYIPGRVWQIASMTFMARRHGIAALRSSSLFIVNQLLVVLGGFLFVLIFGFICSDIGRGAGSVSLLPLAPILLLLAFPNAIVAAINLALRLLHRQPIDYRLSYGYAAKALSFVFCSFLLTGSGFIFLALGCGLRIDDFFFMLAVYPFAYLLGYLAVIAPGGIGVRESFMIFILKSHYSADMSALLTLAAFFWWLAVEFANTLAAYATIKLPVPSPNDSTSDHSGILE